LRQDEGKADAGAGGRQLGDPDGQLLDDRRIGGFRGPLVFGLIAATIEMGVILALLYC
jgi:hypothetical protein